MTYETCLCIGMRNAAQKLTQAYDRALSPAGITANQFSMMGHITKLDSPTMKELANACGLDRSTLGRNLPVLEKKKLITIQTGEDARTRQIKLTSAGAKACKKAMPLWRAVQKEFAEKLGGERRYQLNEMLTELAL